MNKQQQIQHYKDTKGSVINQEDFTYLDTKQVQLDSLVNFAESFGYCYYPIFNHFYRESYTYFKGCEILSVSTMVNLHNSEWIQTNNPGYFAPTFKFVKKLGGGYFDSTFFVDADALTKAKASKIVCQVFLHSGKNGVTCYKHQVKWADSAYESLFLKNIHKEAQ